MCWTERARDTRRLRGVHRHGHAVWLCVAASVAIGWSARGLRADDSQPACGTAVDGQALQRRVIEVPFDWDSVPVLKAVTGSQSRADGGLRSCPPVVVTHTDAPFNPSQPTQYIAEEGFAQTEIAAASYTIAASEFPIKINMTEIIFVTDAATVQTVTQWSVLVWDGNPNTGTLVASNSSDDVILPHLRLGPGTQGANIQFSVDPGDPDQIYIYDTGGTHTFSVGYRIDHHNNQTQNPCYYAPPPHSNAFPTVDASGLSQPTKNWLYGVPSCPLCGGWSNFASLPAGICRPAGDWVIRVTYEPVNCGPVGACCDGTTCTETSAANCTGVYQGDGSTCSPTNPCLTGACCHANLSCSNGVQQSGCQVPGDSFHGGQTCAQVTCPPPGGACCVNGSCVEGPTEAVCVNTLGGYWAGPGTVCDPNACAQACCFLPDSCVDLFLDQCYAFSGFPQGVGTACATTTCFPAGACCYPNGTCGDNVAQGDCTAAGGTFKGDGVLCSSVSCPQPDGACCSSTNSCIVTKQATCNAIPGAHWAGPFSTCFTGACPICSSGDTNADGDVDFRDFGQFQTCFQGPLGGTGVCNCVDMDNDNDVDLNDYKLFYNVFNVGGPL